MTSNLTPSPSPRRRRGSICAIAVRFVPAAVRKSEEPDRYGRPYNYQHHADDRGGPRRLARWKGYERRVPEPAGIVDDTSNDLLADEPKHAGESHDDDDPLTEAEVTRVHSLTIRKACGSSPDSSPALQRSAGRAGFGSLTGEGANELLEPRISNRLQLELSTP